MKRSLDIFLLLALPLAVQPANATPIRISLELVETPAAGTSIAGTLKLVSRSEPEQTLEIPAKAPGEQQVDLQSDRTWEVRFEAKELWGETLTIGPQPVDTVRRLRVFPAGRIRAGVQEVVGEKPLRSLALRLQSSFAVKANSLEVAIACPIAKGALACEVPAGKFDLRLRAEGGFAPVYFWGVQVSQGKDTDLGTLRWRRGASVSGWVQTTNGHPPSSDCRLKLTPDSAITDDLKIRDQIEKSSLEAQPNEKGFFQILGVPPGRYELTARQPGFADAQVRPIDVRPDLESQVLDHLVLAKPVSFDITLDPPVEPYGNPWRLELAQRTEPSEPPSSFLSATASQEGVWRVPGVAPGTYELSVRGDQKAVWYQESIEIHPGQSNLRIDLPVLQVEGRILLGREPLAATLWLRDKGGRRLRFDSDDRGRFSGLLPREGLWAPQIVSETAKLKVSLEDVEIKPLKGSHRAKVEIKVPNTRLAGQTVDEAGQPVPAAQILAAPLEKRGTDHFEADEKGEFSVRGLHPGSLFVKAEEGDRQSDFVPVNIPEEGEAPWLRLVLRRLQTFEGRIVSAAGGVAGARIVAWPPFNGQSSASSADAVSGADGSFHVELPSGTAALNLAILPPGYAMRLLALPVSPGQPIEIQVEPQGGTLILDLPDGGPAPLLAHGGIFAFLPSLRTWARMQGERPPETGKLVLHNVEAGPYSFCRGAAAVSRMKEGGEPPAANCTSGVLAPNGDLLLNAPPP
ncbi:MAG: hypothetical protein WAM82_33120 [Thermoanaerobaculia bacterium]